MMWLSQVLAASPAGNHGANLLFRKHTSKAGMSVAVGSERDTRPKPE